MSLILVFGGLVELGLTAETLAGQFRVRFTETVHNQPFSGRVYLFFSRTRPEPRAHLDWFQAEPVIALDVDGLSPGEWQEFDLESPSVLRFPPNFTADSVAGWKAQAVFRFNDWERDPGEGPGNGTSTVQFVPRGGQLDMTVDRLIPARRFPDLTWTKELRVPSAKLSEFYKRDVSILASVTLPASYLSQPDRRYPVILEIPGFTGRHDSRTFLRSQPVRERNGRGVEFLRVTLDPNCPRGHHAFADSANNGPWGSALIEEFLPALDQAYRTTGTAAGRFLTGHSSGGWSSLWLQMTYPQQFNGTWSTSPDSPDFRDFQRVNLYQDRSLFRDEQGQRRPLGRINGRVVIWTDEFSQLEEVLGPGGQLHSFEAVFSPADEAGRPRLMWNRQTGEIQPETVAAWKAYDISLLFEQRWPELKDPLQGKIHIFMGLEDTFFLEGGTQRLKERLQSLGSDATVELFPGRDHFNLFQGGLRGRIEQQIADRYLNSR